MTDYIAQLTSARKFERDESERLAHQLSTAASICDGVIRWHSNSQVPPADCVALAVHLFPDGRINVAACNAARDADLKVIFADYRRAKANRTPEQVAEQRAEARAAHGPGVTLVDVISGERWTT